ncbi:hypothetical protein [Curtobacterium sp. VKM Ac-1376]|uniref:hypothetical protein n=1 Tax=Curtobacterium sp. VKM Ac-1376 TaxID=123312 RepID=UPI00188A31F6|nr:hypothetical protein [Curtobacterium sp. VKM Ac-1376]MBF4615484.1 hypothetical protein [Curtobacterium sp. VKM Ac-1376]
MTGYDHDKIAERISEARFRSYLAESDNTADALELYRWNAAMASAMFELVGHVEVVLRNTVDSALRVSTSEDERGIPWFMLRIPKVTTKLDTPEWDDLDGDRDSALANLHWVSGRSSSESRRCGTTSRLGLSQDAITQN